MMWDIITPILLLVGIAILLKGIFYKTAKFVEYFFKYLISYTLLIIIITTFMPLLLWNGKSAKNMLLLSRASRIITKFLNIKWHLRNFDIVAGDKRGVVLINHQSSMDLLCMSHLWLFMGKSTCVSKKEILYYFPLGLALYLMDFIFIDRGKPKDAHKILQAKAEKFFQNETKIIVFPEGKRSNDFTKLLPFKKGAFIIAVKAQVPIIPIVVSRYYFINKKKYIFNDGHAIVQCLEPVSTEGLTMDDVPDLIDRVHSNMERVFKELSNEAISSLPPNYPLETLN